MCSPAAGLVRVAVARCGTHSAERAQQHRQWRANHPANAAIKRTGNTAE
jgi:hypothetical protein